LKRPTAGSPPWQRISPPRAECSARTSSFPASIDRAAIPGGPSCFRYLQPSALVLVHPQASFRTGSERAHDVTARFSGTPATTKDLTDTLATQARPLEAEPWGRIPEWGNSEPHQQCGSSGNVGIGVDMSMQVSVGLFRRQLAPGRRCSVRGGAVRATNVPPSAPVEHPDRGAGGRGCRWEILAAGGLVSRPNLRTAGAAGFQMPSWASSRKRSARPLSAAVGASRP
jgi:hypothetical protein